MPNTSLSAVFDTHVSVMVLAIGLVLALACNLLTRLSPGGMVVPGWLALSLVTGFSTLAVTAVVTAATTGVALLLRRHAILYGKRLFAAVVLTGTLIMMTGFLVLQPHWPWLFTDDTLGFVIPGLLSYQLLKQRVVPTLVVTAVVIAATSAFIVLGVAL